ncbi:MAG: hypothetical protein U5O69_01710 [Candidatus Competibacteraceae bacterium]|nr:hypothetical protein [Candidatus Competibacteraceae bacterium]
MIQTMSIAGVCRSNVLRTGDLVVIPDKRRKEDDKSTDQRHQFRRKGFPHYDSHPSAEVRHTPRRRILSTGDRWAYS